MTSYNDETWTSERVIAIQQKRGFEVSSLGEPELCSWRANQAAGYAGGTEKMGGKYYV